jgi:hypothetical protein
MANGSLDFNGTADDNAEGHLTDLDGEAEILPDWDGIADGIDNCSLSLDDNKKGCLRTWMAYIKASLKARLIWMAQQMALLTLIAQQMATLKACLAWMAQAQDGIPGLCSGCRCCYCCYIGLSSRSKNQESGKQPPAGQNWAELVYVFIVPIIQSE